VLYDFFWVIPRRLKCICRRFGTECSETSASKFQTPGNYPKESRPHLEQGESLTSIIICVKTYFRHVHMLICYISLNSHHFNNKSPSQFFPISRSLNLMEIKFKENRLNAERTLHHVHISSH
jgi:hypothetical protein